MDFLAAIHLEGGEDAMRINKWLTPQHLELARNLALHKTLSRTCSGFTFCRFFKIQKHDFLRFL